MREALAQVLRCPVCASEGRFELTIGARSPREIVEATLRCASCAYVAEVRNGVVDMLHSPPPHVQAEAGGLARFAELMRREGWDRERILRLPDDPLPYWQGQKQAAQRLTERVQLVPGRRLLDLGANTCWASNIFARLGLEVIALDIATVELQGLDTARWWFDGDGTYFERLLSSMASPALATASIDYVFASQVLHHNSREDLHRTMAEMHRVLRPGGLLMAVSEPLRFITDLKRDHGEEVVGFEGNENVYFAWEYVRAARGAGFGVELVPPAWPTFTGEPLAGNSGLRKRGLSLLRRSPAGRAALHRKALLFGPDHPLFMVCQKER